MAVFRQHDDESGEFVSNNEKYIAAIFRDSIPNVLQLEPIAVEVVSDGVRAELAARLHLVNPVLESRTSLCGWE